MKYRRILFLAAPALSLALLMTVSRSKAQNEEPRPVLEEPAKPKKPGMGEVISSWFGALTEAVGEPEVMESEASAILLPGDYLTEEELRVARPWNPPFYGEQTSGLGWSEKVFHVPEGMKARVAFWKDIYTKYSSNQGVIHDTTHIHIVYTPVDFGAIMRDPNTTTGEKARLREKLVNDKRNEIVDRLKKLQDVSSPDDLTGEDLRIWKLFEKVEEPDKFAQAASKNRVRFQLGQKDRFVVGIYHSGRYLREMEDIFRSEGLPIELTRLPFVESSFNIRARSRVGASGIWQFMPRTAKPYMKVNKDVDERNDPITATRSSARLLKQNYSMLQSWPLAITGYNHGAYGVRGIVAKLGTSDITEIIKRAESRSFGFASENFYACFLAALESEREAQRFYGDVKWGPEPDVMEIKVPKPLKWSALLEFFDGDLAFAELTNAHFTSRVKTGKAMIPKGSFIRVPTPRMQVAQDHVKKPLNAAKLASLLRTIPIQKPPTIVPASGEIPKSQIQLMKDGASIDR